MTRKDGMDLLFAAVMVSMLAMGVHQMPSVQQLAHFKALDQLCGTPDRGCYFRVDDATTGSTLSDQDDATTSGWVEWQPGRMLYFPCDIRNVSNCSKDLLASGRMIFAGKLADWHGYKLCLENGVCRAWEDVFQVSK